MRSSLRSRLGYLLVSLLLLGAGVLFIAFRQSLRIVTVCIGVLLLLFAVVRFVLALADRGRNLRFALTVALCVICFLAGGVTAVLGETATEVAVVLSGLLLVVDGSFKLHTVTLSKRYSLWGWWLLMFLALAVILGGFWNLKFPPEGDRSRALLLGVILCTDGIANFFSAFFLTGVENRAIREVSAALQAGQATPNADAGDAPKPKSAADAAPEADPAPLPTADAKKNKAGRPRRLRRR